MAKSAGANAWPRGAKMERRNHRRYTVLLEAMECSTR